ncbi:MAG: PAS domain S-box protein, partial [Bacteroidota bacterium]
KLMSYYEMTPEKYKDKELEQLKSLELTGRYGPYEKEYIHKNGHWVPVRLSGTILEKDGIKYIWSSVEDITEQTKAKGKLRKSEERYRQIVETSQEGIWLIDENRKTNFVNKRICEMLEYSPEEMMGKDLFDFMDEEGMSIAKDSIAQQKVSGVDHLDFKFLTKTGAFVWAYLATSAVVDDKGNYIGGLAMVTDITVRKQQEVLLRNSETFLEVKNKELERKNKELEQFAYVASHDLQEPLRTTTSFVELLQRQYKGKLDQKADKYLDYIIQSSGRMEVLIKDLLDYSRIGHEKELQQVDCNKIVQDVLADLDTAIAETQATVRVASLPVIQGYPTEVKQLFQNLVANAIKFRKKDTKPEINISVQKRKDYWEFAIKDNGIGIEKEQSERIFIIFQRLHTRTEYKGSGIGLSHCKKIVELHNGKIWVTSNAGEGSTFHFTIQDNYAGYTKNQVNGMTNKTAATTEKNYAQ